jgi:ribonuclease P protein component
MTRCVKRKFRLTRSTDFKRVRRFGKSYAHPLVVLVTLPNEQKKPRLAVSAGRSVGGAVERNRAKRLLREAIRPNLASITPGWDYLFLARRPILSAAFPNVTFAVTVLLHQAHLWKETDVR